MLFNTLNEALSSYKRIDLVALWPLGVNINYGCTARVTVERAHEDRLIQVYRNETGLYEAPITYKV